MSLRRVPRVAATLAGRPALRGPAVRALARGSFRDLGKMARTVGRPADLGVEKIVCSRYRFLCILVPKAASRSLLSVLRDAAPDTEVFHDRGIAEVYAACPESREYFSFAFVRDPCTRALSLHQELFRAPTVYAEGYGRYRGDRRRRFHDPVAGRTVRFRSHLEALAGPERKEEKRRNLFARYYGLEETRNFDDFCEWLNTPWGSDAFADRHFLSQHRQIRLDDGRLPDFVGRFERLGEDLREIGRRLDFPAPTPPLVNTMAGWQSTPEEVGEARRAAEECLTSRNRRLLSTRYAADFRLGGYSP